MFDPTSVGKIDAKAIEVIRVLPSQPGKLQLFEAVVTLQGNKHRVLFKPNRNGKRDQIVADRLKHIFSLTPMHCVSAHLNFCYQHDERVEWHDGIEYLMLAAKVTATKCLRDVNFQCQSDEFKKEVFKIIMFRFIIGARNTTEDHIVIRSDQQDELDIDDQSDICSGLPMSISEMTLASALPPRDMVEKYINSKTDLELLKAARLELGERFDNDCLRGVIFGRGKIERDLDRLISRPGLTIAARRTAQVIEERFDLVMNCDLKTMLNVLTKK